MLGSSSVQCTVLTVVSLASLSLLCLLCLRCKKKSIPADMIHEETQIYNSQTFQSGRSRFTVMRSKTVIKANQIPPCASNEDFNAATGMYSMAASPPRGWEHVYVAPLPFTVYENDTISPLKMKDADPLMGDYANIPAVAPKNEDDEDYENSEFLAQRTLEVEDGEGTLVCFFWFVIDVNTPFSLLAHSSYHI
nr:LAT2 domain-containing protein isoform X2 [Doryrhamphus excisus]XP_057942143.1 LAT2 domain-containing protein isoform X2 [Doryrhamphus excisus]